ncbi:MAG TPA: hypothetical protein GXZ77_00870 [Papillibacter sp.]|nr:hypothetical protein [Papillibacter sp.]
MLCLLKKRENFEKGEFVRVQGARILGVRAAVISVCVPENRRHRERAFEAALGCLSEMRPRRVVYGKSFPFARRCVEAGFTPAGADFHSALAAKVAITACPQGDAVYVCAARADRAVLEHIRELSRRFRHVFADVAGGAGIIDDFMRRCGVSIVLRPAPERILSAHAAVFFHEPEKEVLLSGDCVTVLPKRAWLEKIRCGTVVTGITVALSRGAGEPLPEEFPPEPFISAALEAGTLQAGDLVITDIAQTEIASLTTQHVLTNAGSNSII